MILRSHQRTKDPEIKKYWTAQQLLHQTAMVQVFLVIYSIIQDPTEYTEGQSFFPAVRIGSPPASSTRQ